MDILELIDQKINKFGLTYEQKDTEILLQEVDQLIMNFCHIDSIPEKLLFVRVNICVDYIRFISASVPLEGDSLDVDCAKKVGPLTLVSAGDVTYQFGSVQASRTNVANAHTADLDSFILNYEKQLLPFRRLVW